MKRLIFFVATLALFGSCISEKLMLCYYGSWATYRNGKGACHVQDLNPFICTHLIYTFVGINEDASIMIMDPWLELPDNWGRDNFGELNKLKKINPKLKTIIAIGGWNELSAKYSKVANDPILRSKFAKNAAEFTVKYGFDGFDLDWEYPGQRDSVFEEADIEAHALLLQEMRQEFDKYGLLLTAAVASVESSASQSYDIPALAKYLDFINVMTYDLHGAWDTATGHNANLRQYEMDVDPKDSYDVETAIDFWISKGAPKEKLIMGLPLYGRTFSLSDPTNTTVGALSSGAGIAGQYTYQNGMIGLNELCEKQMTQSWPEHWDEVAAVPYTFKGKDWISYDNHESLKLKAEFAMSKGLAGVMVWSIETDDFRGVCHQEKFAYLRTINKAIGRVIDETTTTEAPSSSSTSTTTTAAPGSSTTSNPGTDGVCKKPGYNRDPDDCSVFYNCVSLSSGGYKIYNFKCPGGLYFDDIKYVCNYPELVNC